MPKTPLDSLSLSLEDKSGGPLTVSVRQLAAHYFGSFQYGGCNLPDLKAHIEALEAVVKFIETGT